MNMQPVADPLFDRDGWWEPGCRAFASLRAVSAFRLQLLQRWFPHTGRGLAVDLGCGGGLLAVPLARAGATVVGIDLSHRALAAARAQGVSSLHGAVGDLHHVPIADGVADLVLLADVLEHVEEPARVVLAAARLLAPGGHLFVNTISRTLRSRVLAIGVAEGLGLVPRGTHRWSAFIRPEELAAMAAAAGLRRVQQTGEAPALWRTLRHWRIELRESSGLALGYAALFAKAPD